MTEQLVTKADVAILIQKYEADVCRWTGADDPWMLSVAQAGMAHWRQVADAWV